MRCNFLLKCLFIVHTLLDYRNTLTSCCCVEVPLYLLILVLLLLIAKENKTAAKTDSPNIKYIDDKQLNELIEHVHVM